MVQTARAAGKKSKRVSGSRSRDRDEHTRAIANDVDGDLFEKLRATRKGLAEERGVPAYVVFSDATLLEMAARKPTTSGELAQISGVGPTKLSRYGEDFLSAVREHG
jgi:ATP-dependent DNA helicase RecQ